MKVIDVHTHMVSAEWLGLLERDATYTVNAVTGGSRAIHRAGAPFMTLTPEMFDYEARIRNMDLARVDMAVVSLTCPNVYWGDAETSTRAAQSINDSMAAAQSTYPERIRWLASLPWQYPDRAIAELERASAQGARGVMVLAHVEGASLTDPRFAEVWTAISERELPVLLHPTAPPGVERMDMQRYNLIPIVGFMFDTTLAVSRMILDGFFDRYPGVKLICGHAGGCLPFLMGRLDMWYESYEPVRATIRERPSTYANRLYADSLAYADGALKLTVEVFGADRVLYGTDYPHKNGHMADCLARLDALPPASRSQVRGLNAQRLFAL